MSQSSEVSDQQSRDSEMGWRGTRSIVSYESRAEITCSIPSFASYTVRGREPNSVIARISITAHYESVDLWLCCGCAVAGGSVASSLTSPLYHKRLDQISPHLCLVPSWKTGHTCISMMYRSMTTGHASSVYLCQGCASFNPVTRYSERPICDNCTS